MIATLLQADAHTGAAIPSTASQIQEPALPTPRSESSAARLTPKLGSTVKALSRSSVPRVPTIPIPFFLTSVTLLIAPSLTESVNRADAVRLTYSAQSALVFRNCRFSVEFGTSLLIYIYGEGNLKFSSFISQN